LPTSLSGALSSIESTNALNTGSGSRLINDALISANVRPSIRSTAAV
jgi:hypothetical protein